MQNRIAGNPLHINPFAKLWSRLYCKPAAHSRLGIVHVDVKG
jgi:hypothetical protein